MTYSEFLANSKRPGEVWLLEITAPHRGTDEMQTFRFSTKPYCHGDLYEPVLEQPRISASVQMPGSGARALLTPGEARIRNQYGKFDPLPRDYRFSGAECRVLHGSTSLDRANFGSWTFRLEGEPQPGPDSLIFALRTNELQGDFQPRKYRGFNSCLWNGSASFGNPAKLDLTGDLTISAWIYASSNVSTDRTILSWASSGATRIPFSFVLDASNALEFGTDGYTIASGITLAPNEWNHVAVTREGTEITLHAFRESDRSESIRSVQASTAPQSADGTLELNVPAGMIAQLIVWNRALNRTEMKRLRSSRLPATEVSSTIAYWPMDATTGTTLEDLAANPAHGTAANSLRWLASGEGAEDLAGREKPYVDGKVRNHPLVLVDANTLLYQLSTSRLIVEAVREGGAETIEIEAAHGTLHDLLFVTVSPGKARTYQGPHGTFLKLGSQPSLPIGVDASSSNPAAGDVLTQALTVMGENPLTAEKIVGATQLTADTSSAVVRFAPEPSVTFSAAIETFLDGLQTRGWINADGDFVARRIEHPDEQPAAAELTRAHFVSTSGYPEFRPSTVSAPAKSVSLLYEINGQELGSSELGNVDGDAAYYQGPGKRAVRTSGEDYSHAADYTLPSAYDSEMSAQSAADRWLHWLEHSPQSFVIRLHRRLIPTNFELLDSVAIELGRYNFRTINPWIGSAARWLVTGWSLQDDEIELVIWRPFDNFHSGISF